MFEALFTSTLVVALAEIGDKTMLLAIVLAARLRKPLPILAGIFCATIANHALAAFVGKEVDGLLNGQWLRFVIAFGFVAIGFWTLMPDKLDDDEGAVKSHGGAFLTTLVAFFFVEMGDKTQIATIALGAQYRAIVPVAIGTTLGMMIANTPAVLLGERITRVISLKTARTLAAISFIALGLWQFADLLGLRG